MSAFRDIRFRRNNVAEGSLYAAKQVDWFSRIFRSPICDRQTDTQTQGPAMLYTAGVAR